VEDLWGDGPIAYKSALGQACHEEAAVREHQARAEGELFQYPQLFVVEHHAVEVVYQHINGLRGYELPDIGAEEMYPPVVAQASLRKAVEQSVPFYCVDTACP